MSTALHRARRHGGATGLAGDIGPAPADPDDADDLLFKALGHRVRRRLLDAMKTGPRTTGMLCEAVPELDRCTVMQHLRVLEQAGLVVVERRGRERWNSLDALPIHGIHERWIGPYAAYASTMLGRLKRRLSDEAGS